MTSHDNWQLALLQFNPATATLMGRRYGDPEPDGGLFRKDADSGIGTILIRLAKAAGSHTVNRAVNRAVNVVRLESPIGGCVATSKILMFQGSNGI